MYEHSKQKKDWSFRRIPPPTHPTALIMKSFDQIKEFDWHTLDTNPKGKNKKQTNKQIKNKFPGRISAPDPDGRSQFGKISVLRRWQDYIIIHNS